MWFDSRSLVVLVDLLLHLYMVDSERISAATHSNGCPRLSVRSSLFSLALTRMAATSDPAEVNTVTHSLLIIISC